MDNFFCALLNIAISFSTILFAAEVAFPKGFIMAEYLTAVASAPNGIIEPEAVSLTKNNACNTSDLIRHGFFPP